MINKEDIFPIGIGTWGIGGLAEKDPNNDDDKQTDALRYMLDHGMNFAEMCYFYSEGHAVNLFIEALKSSKVSREDLFIVASIYPHRNDTIKEAEKEFEVLLKLFDTNYRDSVQFTGSSLRKWGFEEAVKLQEKLLNQKTSKSISLTNVNLETLKRYKKIFGDKFFSHELHYSFEVRETEDFGLIKYAKENNILNVIFQPLRRNKTAERNWPLLVELSEKYGKSQNQIIMNWLVSKGFLPITKSETIKHIDEHLKALDFDIEEKDLQRLNEFRPPGWVTPKIDWNRTGEGVVIHQLPNVFDEMYDKKIKNELI